MIGLVFLKKWRMNLKFFFLNGILTFDPTMSHRFATPLVPISWGELVDKVTILEIKLAKIIAPQAQANVKTELNHLTRILTQNTGVMDLLATKKNELSKINQKLWQVEDDIRGKEAQLSFDQEFIELARRVYRLNDERAKVKRKINDILGSELVEEKSYKIISDPSGGPNRVN